MVLGDGAPWIKNIAKFIQEYFLKNKVHYTIDKFHLTKRFKDLFPFQHKNKLNKKAYNDAISYFYDGNIVVNQVGILHLISKNIA
ncbi:hypothetical protein [Spiroplasma kunkelii]|uniref:hypothetical protein n=1 Tax=Spiroplasma kunkelii TaxID=47834 RepID=UPI000325F944|nr:hypothetical protein [Spiroplasma kunkelii]